jgi:hypothetical protein
MLIYVVDVVSALVISPMSRTRPEPVCPVIDTREAAALDALVAAEVAEVAELDAEIAA